MRVLFARFFLALIPATTRAQALALAVARLSTVLSTVFRSIYEHRSQFRQRQPEHSFTRRPGLPDYLSNKLTSEFIGSAAC